tara:strand:+ start:885 stop:1646 length:762 start_codon:yes stop_codon:yes gene_type:complete
MNNSKSVAMNDRNIGKKFKKKKNIKIIKYDTCYEWSIKSKDVAFKSDTKCVGNGEKKLAIELGILTNVGGQNSTADLFHDKWGPISVKDMTNDNCTLGTEGCFSMRKIFRTTINLFVGWLLKYKDRCSLTEHFYNKVNKKYGQSRITVLEGIDRYELSRSSLTKLNEILNELKKCYFDSKDEYKSLQSEYAEDIVAGLGSSSLQELLDDCVRKEAKDMTLIIVYEKRGWCIVKDLEKLTCPRITRGAPRINYK